MRSICVYLYKEEEEDAMFLCLNEARLDRVAIDTNFNDTGMNDRGEEKPTPASLPKSDAVERALKSHFALHSDQMQTRPARP